VAIASLAKGQSVIRRPLASGDTQATVDCYRALGAAIDTSDPDVWKVTGTAGRIRAPKETIDVGNSGTTLRIAMASAALARTGRVTTFTGDEQLRSRPIGPLADALTDLGAKCKSLNNNGKAPIEITGQLTGGKTSIAATTSQYLSSLLLCTPLAAGRSEIDVTEDMRKFRVKGNQSYRAFDEAVAADFSSATFFLCAAALVGDEVTLQGLDFTDSQPDKAVVDYLKKMGAEITIEPNSVTINAASLHGAEIDMNKTPDALPAMAVTAAFAEGTTSLVNVPQARSKETDRIKCMAEELKKMAVAVEELPDGLIIEGGRPGSAELDGRSDHRIVMALSLVGLAGDGRYTVNTAEAMSVTFPDYVELMTSIGANMEVN
jgi:3-phosphoshikimate 1-carboxyvinyltransferase